MTATRDMPHQPVALVGANLLRAVWPLSKALET